MYDIFNGFSKRFARVRFDEMIHDEWNVILSVERSSEYARFDAKRADRPLIPRQKFRDGILRDVFLEINIYTRARVRASVCVHQHVVTIARPSSCHFMRFASDAIITMSNRDIRISIHYPHHLMPRIWNPFSLSLSPFVLHLSRCVFSTLITNFDNIRSRSVNICMQNAGWGLYFLHETCARKISVEPR